MKFSFRLTFATFEILSGFTLLTLRPPGLRLEGIHSSRRSLTVSVRESLEGTSGAGAAGAFTVRLEVFRDLERDLLDFEYLDLRDFDLRDFDFDFEEVCVVFAFVRFLAAYDSVESKAVTAIMAAIKMYMNLRNFISCRFRVFFIKKSDNKINKKIGVSQAEKVNSP